MVTPSNSYADNVYFTPALFVEMPSFEQYRAYYLDDTAFRAMQLMLMKNPMAGDVIPATGGLRKHG
jgi:hypothetical protein